MKALLATAFALGTLAHAVQVVPEKPAASRYDKLKAESPFAVATVVEKVEEKKENYYRCERETGVFFRTIPLPEGIKAEQVAASFNDGVLEVTVPLPVAKPVTQKIAITEAPAKAA